MTRSALKLVEATPRAAGRPFADGIVESQSDIGAVPRTDPSAQPWAAFDGDPGYGLAAGPGSCPASARGCTLRLDRATIDYGSATIALDLPASETRQLVVFTESGNRTVTVRADVRRSFFFSVPNRSRRPHGASARSTLRPVEVSEVELPFGLALSRPLVMPSIILPWVGRTPTGTLMQGADRPLRGVSGRRWCSSVLRFACRAGRGRPGSGSRADPAGPPGLY